MIELEKLKEENNDKEFNEDEEILENSFVSIKS